MIISIIFLLGALHGFCLSVVLAFKKVNIFPNRLLSILMLVFTIDLGMAAFHTAQLPTSYPHLIGVDYPLTLLYGPLLFLYVKTLSRNIKQLTYQDWLHFVPFLLLLLYMIPFYASDVTTKIQMLGNMPLSDRAWSYTFINHGKVIHGVSYVFVVVSYLFQHRKNLKNNYSSIEKVNLSWLQNLIAGAAVLGIFAAILHLLSTFETTVILGMGRGIYSEMTLLAVTIFVYGIGYMGLNQPEVFVNLDELEAGLSEKQSSRNESHEKIPEQSYQKSGLDETEAQKHLHRLVALVEDEKLYQESDLNLGDLANALDLPPHNVTEIINRYLGKNFYDFINEYRVEEVKEELHKEESHNKKLLAIALDAGFNSKSTFNSVFKKMTGMTPSQYRNSNGRTEA